MVCLGNICRSPLAEGILRYKAAIRDLPWEIDSAGTISWHKGKPPDRRSIAVARSHGIDISELTARKIKRRDLTDFDRIVAMDHENYQHLLALGQGPPDKIEMMLNYLHPGQNRAVPDPYYGEMRDFEEVFALLDQACDAMIERLTSGH